MIEIVSVPGIDETFEKVRDGEGERSLCYVLPDNVLAQVGNQ